MRKVNKDRIDMVDYYNILNLSPRVSRYKIAINYKKKITNLVNSSAMDVEAFIKINQAYYILGNEQGRKFYDTLYNCLIGKSHHLNGSSIDMYSGIVEDLAEKGAIKAKSWLANLQSFKDSDLNRPLFVSFLLQGLISGNGSSLALTGAGAIMYILVSFSFLIKLCNHFTYLQFASTLFLGIFGTAILMFRYREFVVSKVVKETQ